MTELESMKELQDHWKELARAAGWRPPVESRLRVVEKCRTCKGSGHIGLAIQSADDACLHCHGTGTITRPLTQEERLEFEVGAMAGLKSMVMPSGVKVILEEDNDDTN